MRLQSLLSTQPLTILAPWVFLRVGWSILVLPLVTASLFFAGNRDDDAPSIPPHKSLLFIPIVYHLSYLLNIQISSFQTAIHRINLPLLLWTYRVITHTCTPKYNLLAILSSHIQSIWPSHWRTLSAVLSLIPRFTTLHNSLIHSFNTLSILLIPKRPMQLSICEALIIDNI